MSIVLKDSKPRMFSTVLDVILFAPMIKTNSLNFNRNDSDFDENPVASSYEVEKYIQNADSIINGYLRESYSAPSGLRITPYAKTPIADITNTSYTNLLAVSVTGITAYTALWTVTASGENVYTLRSSLEGSQGGGSTTVDVVSSNSDVTVGSNSFDGNIEKNDRFYFSVIDCYDLINTISYMLATSLLLEEKYSEAIPNENFRPSNIWDKAIKLLEDLIDPEKPMSLKDKTASVSTIPIDYRVDSLGEDQSGYLTDNDLDL